MDNYEALWGKYSKLPESLVVKGWGYLITALKRKFPSLTESDWAELEDVGSLSYLDCPRLVELGLDYLWVGEAGWEEW